MLKLGAGEGTEDAHISLKSPSFKNISQKGWEPTFLIGAFCLSEELSNEVGFAFSNNGLKSAILLIMSHDLRFGLGIATTYLTYHCLKCQMCANYSKTKSEIIKHYQTDKINSFHSKSKIIEFQNFVRKGTTNLDLKFSR